MQLTCGGLFMSSPTQTQTAAMATKESTTGLFDKKLLVRGRNESRWTH
jgi:enoyl reductase-like protein